MAKASLIAGDDDVDGYDVCFLAAAAAAAM